MNSKHLICPVCERALSLKERTLKCGEGHSYDLAKEGYANLLLPNEKKSADPGDNKIMVNGRREFLQGGYYRELAVKLASLVNEGDELLDAGCGTGYYGGVIRDAVSLSLLAGLDISKFAVRWSAKEAYDSAVVGSVFDMPYCDGAFDTAISVFAPLSPDELFRVLKRGGRLITVRPAEKHLLELKEAMYGDGTYENPPENAQKQLFSKNGDRLFEIESSTRLTYCGEVEGKHLPSLLSMTPYLYTTGEERKQRLLSLPSLNCTFDFYITVYKRLD